MGRKKYEILLDDEHKTVTDDGVTVHRIRAVRDFANVKKGDIGGYIESSNNLAHTGTCWIYEDSIAYGNARVSENAMVYGRSLVFGDAEVLGDSMVVTSSIYDNAVINSHAHISDDNKIHENAYITDCAGIYNKCDISGDAYIGGTIKIFDNVNISGMILLRYSGAIGCDKEIHDQSDILVISNASSIDSIFINQPDGVYYVTEKITKKKCNEGDIILNRSLYGMTPSNKKLAIARCKYALKYFKTIKNINK